MSYPGGKGGAGVYQTIINQMPPHRHYIELFGGGASVFRHKRRSASSTIIERDAAVARDLHVEYGDDGSCSVICGDAFRFLQSHDFQGDELVYADPPYVRSSRKSADDLYRFELTDAEHACLLEGLKALPCRVIVSGYWSDLYGDRLRSWRSLTYTAATRRGPATEWLWCNFPEPVALHDYRYVGGDFRARERIRRKAARWVSRLDAMPPVERLAILSACLELAPSETALLESVIAEREVAGSCIADNNDGIPSTDAAMPPETPPILAMSAAE